MANHPAIKRAQEVAGYAQMARLAVDTLNEIHKEVAKQVQIGERVNAKTFIDEHKYEFAQDPGATAQAIFQHQTGDAAWVCERVTIVQSGAGTVNFYLGSVSNLNLVETVTVPASGLYSDQFANTLYVPRGVQLVVTGLAGIAVRMQIRKLRLYRELLSQEEIYAEQTLTQNELMEEFSGDYTGADTQPTTEPNPVHEPETHNVHPLPARPDPNAHFPNSAVRAAAYDADAGINPRPDEPEPGEHSIGVQSVPGVSHPAQPIPDVNAHMPPGGFPQ